MVNYFLIAVSTRKNLNICREYSIAGFTNSINGAWAFCDIQKGDFASFLYGAKIYDLYRVGEKFGVREPLDSLWEPIKFTSGRTYSFPFRLFLEPMRNIEEPLIRREFSYVAENLLLRGGYRKTHFQADQTTLQTVSQLGEKTARRSSKHKGDGERFLPKFSTSRNMHNPPFIYKMNEKILQSLLRQHLSNAKNLKKLLEDLSIVDMQEEELEVLSEKALDEGHVDLLIKQKTPIGESKCIVVEVKLGRAQNKDFKQVMNYRRELGEECVASVIIAREFSKRYKMSSEQVAFFRYGFQEFDAPLTFDELLGKIYLE